jgi:hypothetical protein
MTKIAMKIEVARRRYDHCCLYCSIPQSWIFTPICIYTRHDKNTKSHECIRADHQVLSKADCMSDGLHS